VRGKNLGGLKGVRSKQRGRCARNEPGKDREYRLVESNAIRYPDSLRGSRGTERKRKKEEGTFMLQRNLTTVALSTT